MIAPNNDDVLCGKNKDCLHFPGSVRFREIIDSYASRYLKCSNKFEKMVITKRILEQVSASGSRFLKCNEAEKIWEEIGMMAARDKIGHSLRFAGRAKRRVRKLHNRSDSLSSIASTESATGLKMMPRDSLVGQLQLGMIIGSSTVSFEASAPMPHLNRMESESDHSQQDENTDIDADVLLVLLQEDSEPTSFDDDLTDEILKAIQSMDQDRGGEEEEANDSLSSLMSGPMGDWEEDRV